MTLSMRSPKIDDTNVSTPYPTAATALPGQPSSARRPSAAATDAARPPAAPSTVFLGLMSVSFVRPRVLPTK
jgi:hypothetical protein